ncbi:atp-binding cassette superfamily [Plasmopara halstedii]|uniref:Atp-binding cassette superfamily n=1 Tax=Plasmopara halstedii TaxID=4781 RepID=A0A0P1A9L0_PLAHL|nr:atp-binding cassette superfamily [Plasmopara halstedii]CEG37080.1 atp-binding cassette superfamily [Plasmopara halstedii]|eukprot:XP_024573449.1 atp-binding cassette superfamily [Plasmopara halstedii]
MELTTHTKKHESNILKYWHRGIYKCYTGGTIIKLHPECFLELQMIAVERVNEYMDLESEEHAMKAYSRSEMSKLPNMWTSAGHIVFKDLTLTYGPLLAYFPLNGLRRRV